MAMNRADRFVAPLLPPTSRSWTRARGPFALGLARMMSAALAAMLIAATPVPPAGQGRPRIGLVPLGTVSPALLDVAKKGIEGMYVVDVVVQPPRDIPRSAYYKPRKRYRAEKLLLELQVWPVPGCIKTVGITGADISTTKDPYPDWGIFGLGLLDGPVCVVSTYRLKRRASSDLLAQRFVKVLNHEIGHTFGLNHCPSEGCLMEDAAGTIKTVDRETGALCPACRARLKARLK
jgi:archaemetzincin